MIELLTFILVTCGVSFIVTQEYIFEAFRDVWCIVFHWSKLLQYVISCPVCLGFWIGLLFSFTPLFPTISFWVAPFITSFCCKLVLIIQGKTEF